MLVLINCCSVNSGEQRQVAALVDKMRSRGLSSIRLNSPELDFLIIFIEQEKNEGDSNAFKAKSNCYPSHTLPASLGSGVYITMAIPCL